ncbi:hypothetical protein DSO57_1011942 [Entomophthora muscae]|uniref:Uncharacterized protein n=1 Tax=Entomophthora muscae TaxID=34485 RepID=A0ACC2U446_9FUNG|nr:hypothetical protein DSO57_1011942 [Entomophthora muscae]
MMFNPNTYPLWIIFTARLPSVNARISRDVFKILSILLASRIGSFVVITPLTTRAPITTATAITTATKACTILTIVFNILLPIATNPGHSPSLILVPKTEGTIMLIHAINYLLSFN